MFLLVLYIPSISSLIQVSSASDLYICVYIVLASRARQRGHDQVVQNERVFMASLSVLLTTARYQCSLFFFF